MSESNYVTKEELGQFGQEIAKGISQGMRDVQRPKVTLGEYAVRNRRKIKTRHTHVWQNGALVHDNNLSDKEIVLLNDIHRSGRYLDRKVEVIYNDQDPSATSVQIRYSDKTRDQRNDLSRLFHSFEDLLSKILVEQQAADEENAAIEEMRDEARRRVKSKRTAQAAQ